MCQQPDGIFRGRLDRALDLATKSGVNRVLACFLGIFATVSPLHAKVALCYTPSGGDERWVLAGGECEDYDLEPGVSCYDLQVAPPDPDVLVSGLSPLVNGALVLAKHDCVTFVVRPDDFSLAAYRVVDGTVEVAEIPGGISPPQGQLFVSGAAMGDSIYLFPTAGGGSTVFATATTDALLAVLDLDPNDPLTVLQSVLVPVTVADLTFVPAPSSVKINELRIDQPSVDLDEYFELRGAAGTPLDGLTYLVLGDGPQLSGVIEEAVDLTGNAIPASGYFVAAEATFALGTADLTTSLNFENGDNVTHMLVSDFTGTVGDDLDFDDDGVLDATPWSTVEDSVGLVAPADGTLLYSENLVGPDGDSVYAHFLRESDGAGSLVHYAGGAFDPAFGSDTPSAANSATGTIRATLGGGVGLRLDAGCANAGNSYLTLLSLSGTSPGTPLGGGVTLPLNFDALTSVSAASAGGPLLPGTLGLLSDSGRSPFHRVLLPPLSVGFVGMTMNAASGVVSFVPSPTVTFASNPIAVAFQ